MPILDVTLLRQASNLLGRPEPSKTQHSPARFFATILLVCVAVFAGSRQVLAQIGGSGSISGTVTDPTGAAIPNALVVAVNNGTGVKVQQNATGSGTFTLSPLEAGQYTVTITAQGFSTLTQAHVQVDALQVVGLKPQLTLGTASEVVTVEGAPPQLDTQNAAIGGTMENEEYTALPLQINGGARNPTAFAYLEPGVAHGGSGVQTGIFSGTGSAGRLDEVYIDGFPQTSIYEQGDPRYVSNLVSVEAVDQFQVITSNPPAAYQGVGLENYTIRSGTNKIHGSVFDYYRDTALDTWGFFQPNVINPLVGHAVKPNEHQSEYGVSLGGPIRRDKIFLFANYDGFYLHRDNNPVYTTIPTLAARRGDFSQYLTLATPQKIYDPASCPVGTQGNASCTRTQFSYMGMPNVIDPARIGKAEAFMQSFLPTPINNNITNNYLSQIPSFSHHWSTMERLDWSVNERQRISIIFGAQLGALYGFQSNGSNPGPLPYTSGQGFETKNKLIQAEHTFTLTPHLVNQFKAGYTRFWGPVFNPDFRTPGFGLGTNAGVSGLPGGQASQSFPTVTWAGNNAETQWSGDQDYNDITNYSTILDNVQYIRGKHSMTFGGLHQWLEVQDIAYTTGVSPVTLAYNNAQTAIYNPVACATPANPTCVPNKSSIDSSSGNSYASFLIGQVNQGSLTQQSFIDTGARIQPSSLYAQDDYAVTPKLTVNLGVRWDYYPAYREVKNRSTFLNINATNPITGNKGALEFAGNGPAGVYCNCSTPVNNWYKNFGPRLGFAYSVRPTTVIRGGFAITYTHGSGARSALFKGTGTTGLSASPSVTSKTTGDAAFLLDNGFPAYTPPPSVNPGYGTFYTTLTNTPAASMNYPDPYLGSRAPYANMYNLGIEQQLTRDMAIQINYVGSQGHFLPVSAGGARGYYNNQLNPAYLALGSQLNATVTPAVIAAAQQTFPQIALPYPSFSGTLAQALLPFPQYSGVSDTYDNIVNSSYNSLQFIIRQRMSHNLEFMLNYTWSAEIDDGGTFRNGYLSNRVERSRGTADVPNVINSTAIWKLPFGKGQALHANNRLLNALMSDFQLSGIYTYSSGVPLAIVASGCVAPGSGQCMPNYNPNYIGNPRVNGGYGKGITAATASMTHYIDVNAFVDPSIATSSNATAAQRALYPNYTIGNLARTRPYGLRGPTAFDGDLSLKRSIAIHDNVKVLLDVSAYNITNSVIMAAPGVNTSSPTSFGVVSSQSNLSRDIQLGARVNF